MKQGFKNKSVMTSKGLIMCGGVHGNQFAAGCGDGNLLVFDIPSSKCLFGFGVVS